MHAEERYLAAASERGERSASGGHRRISLARGRGPEGPA